MIHAIPAAARVLRGPLLLLFAISGFTGLVYESIWTHYLKLLLGHAAYAQTLVLAIFMGGMALGAWLASRRGDRVRNPILAYALVELVIGAAAFGFHPLFEYTTGWVWSRSLGCDACLPVLKWTLGTALILPQSVLLGMTFPLMSAGVARLAPERTGATIALLYFSNSAGAALGALGSVFVLLPAYGLPGTLAFAGSVNLVLALAVLLIGFGTRGLAPLQRAVAVGRGPADPGVGRLLLAAALLTGFASFCYEIAWIRLLSLVLGTTMHAFELMLSAFIFGLALGGLWIRGRLDRLPRPLRLAGTIQVLMALAALATLPGYAGLYDLMAGLISSTARNAQGYLLFNVGSHAIALLLMLPATVLAGMTLPLFTVALLKSGQGERSIGRIYAANTLGAILGVLVAIHLVMPYLGTRALIGIGALVDLGLGLWLMQRAAHAAGRLRPLPLLAGVLAFALLWPLTRIDPYRVASGVYRHGQAALDPTVEVPYLRDGKTSTVALLYDPGSRQMGISTNGKTEAKLGVGGAPATPDEVTMGLVALLPLALLTGEIRAANIGFGSGMTSDVLLASPRIRSLDSIEIEPAVLEAARGFGPRVHRVFGDPRSVLRSEDARTFFSRQAAPYDLIISEPSNPWVSGVASLFTEEFYHQVAARLTEHGLFVQWINLYEFNLRLLASVMGALGAAFDDYQVFNALDGNLLILSGRRPLPGRLDGSLFDDPALADELARLGFTSIAQLERRYLGARRDLEPWFAGFGVPGNSDYRPLVALQAPAARFLGQDAGALTWLQDAPLPVVGRRPVGPAPRPGSVATEYVVERGAVTARALAAYLDGSSDRLPRQQRLAHAAHQLARSMAPCGQPAAARILVDDLFSVAAATAPYLAPEELAGMWARLASRLCLDADMLPDRWLGLHWAVAAREADKARVLAEALLRDGGQDVDQVSYLLGAGLWAALSSNDRQAGRAFLAAHRERLPAPARQPHYLRVLLARLAKG